MPSLAPTLRRFSARALLLAASGLPLACPQQPESELAGGQSGDEGTDHTQGQGGNGGPIQLPWCSRIQVDGPRQPDRHYRCVTLDPRYRSSELSWNGLQPTPPGPYACECNSIKVDIAHAETCEAALESACQVDLQAPQACSIPPLGTCWPVPEDRGAWRCQCGEGTAQAGDDVPLVDLRNDGCQGAVIDACGAACSDSFSRCEPNPEIAGHDCECPGGEHVAWPGVWSCEAALSTCRPEPNCATGAGVCAPRPGGHTCSCTEPDADQAGLAANPTAMLSANRTFVSDTDAYGNCILAAELACGPRPAGESCQEGQGNEGIFACSSDGAGGWDCACAGYGQTHVTHRCPVAEGTIEGTWAPLGGLPGPIETPPEIGRRAFLCRDAASNCACQ